MTPSAGFEFTASSQPSLTLMQSKFGGSVQDGLRPGRQQIIYYRQIVDEYVARLEDVVKDVRLDVSAFGLRSFYY